LIEANAVHAPALESICRQNSRWRDVLKACGPSCGSIYFNGLDPFGGQARQAPEGEADQNLSMTTIDHEIAAHHLRPPFLIKLDTHGFEIPILKGAEKALEQTEVLVVETYNFVIGAEAVRFWTFCELLARQGFLPVDMFDLLYRPYDRSFWQMDIVFMRSSRPEFQHPGYR
jgi:FkbM family methyltransferase